MLSTAWLFSCGRWRAHEGKYEKRSGSCVVETEDSWRKDNALEPKNLVTHDFCVIN